MYPPRSADVMMLGLRSVGVGQGGVEAHVSNLVDELDALGYTVDVLVRKPYVTGPERSRGRATRLVVLPCARHPALEAITHSLIGVIYAAFRRPAVLHLHAVGPSLVAPLARLLGLRVVCTHHGEDYQREKWGVFARWMLKHGELCQARYAHKRICVSKGLSKRLSAEYGVRFRYIPNGIVPIAAAPDPKTLSQFGLEPAKYILNVSRLVPEKRHFDLIDAHEALHGPDIKLVLVGDADHDSEYARALRARAARSPGVVMAGFQSGAALAALFDGAAVFALPSTHEGLSIALLEALSYGKEVVLSDIEANTDVGLPENCYHKTQDVTDLARRLSEALARQREPSRLSWAKKLDEFKWSKIAEETVRCYEVDRQPPFPTPSSITDQ